MPLIEYGSGVCLIEVSILLVRDTVTVLGLNLTGRGVAGIDHFMGRWPIAYHQAMRIQEILFRDIMADGTKLVDRANLAKAFCTVEEMKRVLQMRPAPKAIDVTKKVTSIEVATFNEDQPKIEDVPQRHYQPADAQEIERP